MLALHPDWILTIIGRLDLGEHQDLFDPSLIELRPRFKHANLAYELARLDIILIPLERNPYCDAKSPLEWYEAALCGTPPIAIGDPRYAQLFSGNSSGIFTSTKDEWLYQMELLSDDAALRCELANNTLRQGLKMFSAKKLAQQLMHLFGSQ